MNKDFRISNLESCFYALFTVHRVKTNNVTQCVMETIVIFISHASARLSHLQGGRVKSMRAWRVSLQRWFRNMQHQSFSEAE